MIFIMCLKNKKDKIRNVAMKEKIKEIIETELDILFNNYPDKNGAQLRLDNAVNKICKCIPSEHLHIEVDGNVGGDINPNQKFEVTGTIDAGVGGRIEGWKISEESIEDLEEHTEKKRGRKPRIN